MEKIVGFMDFEEMPEGTGRPPAGLWRVARADAGVAVPARMWRRRWPFRFRLSAFSLGHGAGVWRIAVQNLPQGLCLYDASDRLLLANARFFEIYRQPPESARPGTNFRDVLAASIAIGNYPGRTVEEVWRERKAFIDLREAGIFLQELGDGRMIAIAHQPMPDGGWLVTYEDVTERRRAEAQTRFLAEHDALTLLPNRRQFEERVIMALTGAGPGATAGAERGRCAVLFVDLDGFKAVNDGHGHAMGDRLLRSVADRLRAEVREEDLAARMGGDEFAVLLRGAEAGAAVAVAERVIAALSGRHRVAPGVAPRIGASVGVACSPKDGATLDELLFHADKALYAAKRAGKGCYCLFGALPVPARAQAPVRASGRKGEDG